MIFKASLDTVAKILTIGITVVFALCLLLQISIIKSGQGVGIAFGISMLLVVVYIVCYLLHPTEYSITSTHLVIHRPIGKVMIAKTDIFSVAPVDPEQMKWTIRTFGVGGLFGYFGKFANSKIGSMTWYATRRDSMLMITTTDHKRIVITPDEPALFLQHINTK
ncbi:MAG: PH domain-containing protein [Chitinophagaceae bacterium]